MNSLGFSTICWDILSEVEKRFVKDTFKFFDISISQLSFYEPGQVLSVQSLFYGKDIFAKSLVRSNNDFERFYEDYKDVIDEVSAAGYKSVIFGSPGFRKNIEVSINDIDYRIRKLMEYALKKGITFYLEALPSSLCDYINQHSEIKKLRFPLHLDFATMIQNKEGSLFLKENLKEIERYHISVPGYSYNFSEYPQIKEWISILDSNNIKGIIEVQNHNEKNNLIEEIEWLLQKA